MQFVRLDPIFEQAGELIPIEIKSGATITKDYFGALNKFLKMSQIKNENAYLVYGGDEDQVRSSANVYSWRNLAELFSKI